MAEGLAIGFANGVLGKLGEIVAKRVLNEASLLLNFRKDFQWLQKKFKDISGYLEYADEQSGLNVSVKRWLVEVSDIALDAQDIIDECAVEPLYTTPTQSYVCRWRELVFRYKMGKRIKDLKDRTSSTIQKAQELNLVHQILHSSHHSTSSSERGAELKRSSTLESDSRVVAMDDKVEEIERLLEEPEIGVVAVVGIGGLGKTFLLQHVYNRAKQRYEHSAWISVSRTCSLRTLLCDLASHINLQIDSGVSDVRAAELIHRQLEGRRCLIVLDDLWSSSVQGDLIQRLGLPTSSNNQCKVMVTTRSRDVAAKMGAHIYEMQQLSKVDSWNLFCLFAFPDSKENRPPQYLESLAQQIVEECGRLPLVVKTVAASMARSSALGVWESKVRQLKDLGGADDCTMQILKLSYDSLPSNLKSCFAYFSFFPEDTEIYFTRAKDTEDIHQDYLIYLWIAEGFIPHENGKELWEIGLNYLHQLVDLCLVEVNIALSCYTLHDLLHDMVINISREHNCEFHLPSQDSSCRRLLLGKKGINNGEISESPLHRQRFLRTISLSQNPEITSIPEHLFDRLRVLRVLDFSRTAISALPKCVGNLKLLKVLNLSQTEIREVPDCVRRLKSLEYLDVSGCTSLQCLPDWIGELKSLSYIEISYCTKNLYSNMPKGISGLSSLRTLRSHPFPLFTEENELLNVEDVGNLINLQEISFSLEDERALRSIQDKYVLEHLKKMRIMYVENNIPPRECDIKESSLPAFPEKMNVMKDLQQLMLARFSVPSWICGMVSLTELTLWKCSDYPSLQNIPNLQSLVLGKDSRCRELPEKFGESGGFPKLVRLLITDFSRLKELPVLEEGAMQRLEVLSIGNCPRVKKVPKGLERLRRLKRIEVEEVSGELEERLREGGEDWSKIKVNNPRIQIDVDY
ncbi:hypothetical protein SUGI_0353770 [Cryptomeria japonica]|uniref:putative disease resistance protein RGA3 n=1 Tax=Cryptomeria japonica TaxID=3369 RepID=UPI002408F1B7|nr:putative disease resistance protein RGA3 [Cryptomeria japonica]GLJ19576.1 hypothetical protein SUGI_0353770 [Cryptomeria japonica]